ncbi:pyridoxal-phosphate dependent enzyme [Amycolatopsis sp. La24]|uniref:1-aminocyclopropane-1-carboxylate deaminase/D-cysteine desulfhydrase n=1 Tax=Amycolatopsis sp. La24 TaxID=3028304 RepID=UPI0023AFAC43|nr:pyridoxal-phosphate dependent enzyme [Amycolatopsis sp. La24]
MATQRPFELNGSPLRLPSPVVELQDDRLNLNGIRLLLKRDDLIHPDVPGNKWRKLKFNVEEALAQGHKQLLTFGGAYSNHLRATAVAGRHFGFSTVGVVRGEEHLPLNESLSYATSMGMRLVYLDRTTYRHKTDPEVLDRLIGQLGPSYVLPEGGSNGLAARGCAELVDEMADDFDTICCASGTGCTLAGIAARLHPEQQAIGFSVLRGGDFLGDEVRRFQRDAFDTETRNWSVDTRFHFGGYARRTPDLDSFIADFAQRHGAALDWVYEAKMMYGIFARAEAGEFAPGSVIVAVVC